MTIDWRRAAQPNADGYDVAVMRELLQQGRYKDKHRAAPEERPRIWPAASYAAFTTLADHTRPSAEFADLSPDHEYVAQSLRFLESWEEFLPLAMSAVAICPFSSGHGLGGHGGTCGNYADDWGWIYCSADNSWGFAEGIVHEMNHWKLRAFGIWFEDWTSTLIANAPDELYDSPVRKDKPRPMGAVLHAHYSYIAVAEMCVRMLEQEPVPTVMDQQWAQLQLHRITEGRDTLQQHFRGTPAGTDFLAGVLEWTDRVIDRGAHLMEHGV